MPNLEKLIFRVYQNLSEDNRGQILASTEDFDYAYVQTKLDEGTITQGIFTFMVRKVTGHYRFL